MDIGEDREIGTVAAGLRKIQEEPIVFYLSTRLYCLLSPRAVRTKLWRLPLLPFLQSL